MGGDLYVGGDFLFAYNETNLAAYGLVKFNGSTWSKLFTGGSHFFQTVRALAVSGSDVYFATNTQVVKWDGTSLSNVGPSLNATIRALAVSGGNVYIGGDFTNISGGGVALNYIAKLNGNTWEPLGTGLNRTGGGSQAFSLALVGGDLYVGGLFQRAGGLTSPHIARWNGSSWNAVGTGLDGVVRALTTGSGGQVHAGGDFGRVGDGSVGTCHYSVYNTNPLPAITSFSPGTGPAGTSVTITGTNFTGATAVAFNGTAASFTFNSATSITATVAAGTTSGTISVTTPSGTATSSGSFTVTIPDLMVSSLQTISGSYNNVTVTGTGVATLAGPLTVGGTLTVQPGGQLLTACQPITGPGSFVLDAGATLGVCDATGISSSGATGAVQLSGTRSFSNDASYRYNGTVAQVSGSGLPALVRELVLSNAAGLTLANNLDLRQVLRLNSGLLRLDGHVLTLRSSAAGTAVLVNAGGQVLASSGTCRMERYIDPSLNPGPGYRHFSSPVTGMTVAQLATMGFTPVLNQAYNTTATPGTVMPFPNVFGYEASRLSSSPATGLSDFDKGWYVPAPADLLAQATGYTVNIPASALVTFSGPGFYQGSSQGYSQPASGAQETPWVLTGNPYPSPFDLSAGGATTSVNFDAARYVFESTSQYGGQYRAYVNGIGGNPLLAAGQGFFVRKTTTGNFAALGFNQAGRITDFGTQVPFHRGRADTRPQLQLTLRSNTHADVAHVYAEASATSGLDVAFDAVKPTNPSGLNLSMLAGTELLAIQGLPAFTAGTMLPLSVQVPVAGTVSFSATLANLPAGLTAYLSDAVSGTRQDLSTTPSYSFTATQAGTFTGRFALVFGPSNSLLGVASAKASSLALYPNPAHTTATLNIEATAQARTVQVLDALGRQVKQQQLPARATSALLELSGLSSGVYLVRCGAAMAKLVVE
ncbi:hypothetical protein GCM10023185_42080 [Hymenobacter saemangeumensis]|uniref:T9SS type A sorting domain-containing protein n=1 Tax=Hymenobacter saemangeumensis TaxID=1084522 RepID=A0ABP8IRJ5_9BACT